MRTKVMRRRWLALLALVAAAAEAAFVPAGPMIYGGLGLRAVPLSNGEVLIVGAPRTQIYEPLGSTFRVTRGEMNVTHRGSAMVTDEQAQCLQALEQITAMGTAARAFILAAFTSGQGYSADADYSPRAWLINRTRITKGTAVAYTAWSRRAAA